MTVNDGTYIGVLDRFEDDWAVFVLQDEGEDIADVLVDREDLPEDARHQDAIFEVEMVDGEVVALVYDPEESETRAEEAQSRFDRLSKRPPRPDEESDEKTDNGG